MAVPIVHHPAYTVQLPHRRGFAMGKYGRLIQLLRDRGLATAQTIHEPDLYQAAMIKTHRPIVLIRSR